MRTWEIGQCEASLLGKPDRHRVSNGAAHGKYFMHMIGVAEKGQQKPAARLDRQLLEFEDDFAASTRDRTTGRKVSL